MMYSWYMPKDQPIEGGGAGPHRHEWEEVVVWLSDDSPDAEFLGLAYSVHGDYDKVKGKDGIKFDGSHPLIEYGYDGFTNHHLWLAEEKGGSQPLIDWNALPEAAQNGLQTGDFEDAHVPFNDENFQGKLKKASL
jgi:hypothetical protein